MNAIYLSRVMDSDFAFTWDSELVADAHHAVASAEEMFEADFLLRHRLEAFVASDYGVLPERVQNRAELKASAGPKGWLVLKNNFPRVLPREMRLGSGAYRDIFHALPFVANLRRAIAAATDVPLLDGTVALHLRAGDIIYGAHRFHVANADKVVCAPVADRVIEDLTSQGCSVLLFSQDPAIGQRYRANARVLLAGDMAADFSTSTERALFEIALMSRAERLFAGSSGFARIAAELSDRRPEAPANLVSPEQQLDCIEAYLDSDAARDDLPALQTAFAAWSGFLVAQELKQTGRALPLLRSAIEYDPANGLYRLKLALALLDLGRKAEAETAFFELTEHAAATAADALTARTLTGGVRMRGELKQLRRAMENGSAGAEAVLTLIPAA